MSYGSEAAPSSDVTPTTLRIEIVRLYPRIVRYRSLNHQPMSRSQALLCRPIARDRQLG